MVVIYLLLISFFLFAYYGGYINSEQLFIGLNIIFSLYIGLLICKQLKKGMSIINPIIVTSIFMFLLPYGFPVLFQYSNGEIRYYPTYISLAKSMLYVNAGFITLWYSYKSLLFNPILYSLKKYSKLFVHKLVVKKTYTYFFLLSSIILNFRSIYSGSYGVLATIYADNKEIGAFDQIEYLVATALKGVVFLLAWQYFKYKRSKKLFIFAFSLLLFFQILAGYKGAIVMTFIIIFIANYLALKKINFKLGIICFISLIIAYGLVNPYREYLVYSKEIPNSISSIFDCIYNGVLIQNQSITSEEVSIIDEVMSRFTTLPELATFIEYKEKFGLHIPRDPDFLYYFYTIPAQLFVPRFLWPDKPVNDLGVWWVSNTVTGNMSNSSTAFGPVGFLYLTFDILAVIIGFLIISFLLKLCEQLLNSGKDGAVLTGVIFLSSLYTNEAGFNTYVVEGIRFLIIGIIFQAIILRRIWK